MDTYFNSAETPYRVIAISDNFAYIDTRIVEGTVVVCLFWRYFDSIINGNNTICMAVPLGRRVSFGGAIIEPA